LLASILPICLPIAAVAADAPAIAWGSDPVKPNETIMLMGAGLGSGAAELGRLPDAALPDKTQALDMTVEGWQAIRPLQASPLCAKFVVPASWKTGIYACRFRNGDAVSNTILLNAPDPWWMLGDQGETASPGGWLRIFGKCLSLDKEQPTAVLLRSDSGPGVQLKPIEVSAYAVRVELPKDLTAGEYDVAVYNGFGPSGAWSDVGRMVIRRRQGWKTDVFNVKDFGPDPGNALLAALKKAETNGGGVVYLPRGRYPVAGHLVIPNNTVLKGESTGLVSLYWPDFDKPPTELLVGVNFGLDSLSLYCQNYKQMVDCSEKSDGVFLHHVRIRANGYFMMTEPGGTFHDRRGAAKWGDCEAAVRLRGKNFEMTDCDVYASGMGLGTFFAKSGVIARNRFFNGERGVDLENVDRIIFEDNFVSGASPLSLGNFVSSFWSSYSRNLWYAHNHIEKVFGGDRETMTLDAGGGAQPGPLVSADGVKLVFGKTPVYRTYAPGPLADWRGAAMLIIEGKGAIQYRVATKHQGGAVEVDRPWTIPPDKTSKIEISPFRGHNLFVGNTIEDGGNFQLYAAAHESIVAENKGARMDGFSVWGINPHGWALQPTWFSQFLDNEIVEGNGYGFRSASFGTVAYDETGGRPGRLVRGVMFRRNHCDNNASISIAGSVADALVEHCDVQHSERGIHVERGVSGVLLRENTFDDVAQPLMDEGSGTVVIPQRQ
jgi:hypothetical protein